jgi:hypothetical protein
MEECFGEFDERVCAEVELAFNVIKYVLCVVAGMRGK